MKTTSQRMVVQVPGHAPIQVNYFCTDEEKESTPVIDLHLNFYLPNEEEVHLTEPIQKKAARQDTMMHVIIAEIVQEYLQHQP